MKGVGAKGGRGEGGERERSNCERKLFDKRRAKEGEDLVWKEGVGLKYNSVIWRKCTA